MPEDWNINDHRWRESKYLDYVYRMHMNDLNYLHLESVERVRFAPDQPDKFAEFGGRLAELGISHLRLERRRTTALHLALASSGLRVPGTRYVLRVTRPWYAFFEEKAGDFPPLPSDWMEGVRLLRCPGGGVEWLGRRNPMAAWEGFDLSGFREMPSGWKCDRPAIPEMDDALRREVDRVLAEIAEYSEHILPQMEAITPGMFPREPRVTRLGQRRWDRPPLIDWQLAAARLAGALTADTASLPRIYNVDEFGDFIWESPGTPYFVENGRIRWLMNECFRESRDVERIPEAFRPEDPTDKEQYLAAIKRWLLDPQTRTTDVIGAFYWGISSIAEVEPEFVREIMDVRTWRARIRANTTLTEAERQDELSETYCLFSFDLNNTLLHVLDSLADNHFMEIRKFLELPSFRGGYAGYLPEYLLQVLFTKVQVLTDLRLCGGRLIGPSRPKKLGDKP